MRIGKVENIESNKLVNELLTTLEKVDPERIKFAVFGYGRGKEKTKYLKQVNIVKTAAIAFKRAGIDQLRRYQSYDTEDYDEAESTEGEVYTKDPSKDDNISAFHKFIVEGMQGPLPTGSVQEINKLDKALFIVKFDDDLISFSRMTKRNLLERKRKHFYLIPSDELTFTALVDEFIYEIPEFSIFMASNDKHIIFDAAQYDEYFNLRSRYISLIKAQSKAFSNLMDDPIPFLELVDGLHYRDVKSLAVSVTSTDLASKKVSDYQSKIANYNLQIVFKNDKFSIQESNLLDIVRLFRDQPLFSEFTGNRYISFAKRRIQK
jgi:hypothetical protein